MKAGPRYHVKPRRHREGRTDYRRRLMGIKSLLQQFQVNLLNLTGNILFLRHPQPISQVYSLERKQKIKE